MQKSPKINGTKIRKARSFSNSFQVRRSMAKQTPMPDTTKRMGMRHTFSMPMRGHRPSRVWSFSMKKMCLGPGLKPHDHVVKNQQTQRKNAQPVEVMASHFIIFYSKNCDGSQSAFLQTPYVAEINTPYDGFPNTDDTLKFRFEWEDENFGIALSAR